MTTLCKTLNDVDEQCSEQHLEDVEILRVDLGIWDFAEYTLNHVSFQNTPLIGVNFRKCQASNITFSVNTSDDRGFWMRGINFATSIQVAPKRVINSTNSNQNQALKRGPASLK